MNNKGTTLVYVIAGLFLLSLAGGAGYFYMTGNSPVNEYIQSGSENSDSQNIDENQGISGEDVPNDGLNAETRISLDDAIKSDEPMDEIGALILGTVNNKEIFDTTYGRFEDLKNYDDDYKQYIKKFPELLPVIYATKMQDKDSYIKFYDFIYEKVYDDGLYISDIESQFGPGNKAEMKVKFLAALGKHYDDIVTGDFSFSPEFGDGPIHIALTNDSTEDALKNCDSSEISGVDEGTKDECYNYVYHYRATKENKLCAEISSIFQQRLCLGYLE